MSYRVVYGETILECKTPNEALELAQAIGAKEHEKAQSKQKCESTEQPATQN